MRYDDIINFINTIANALIDPTRTTTNFNKNNTINLLNNRINPVDNSINTENISGDGINNELVTSNNNTFFNEKKTSNCYNTSSNSQGIIDSITQELTSVRLEQAIILSEIVGKPKSKIRKKRRF